MALAALSRGVSTVSAGAVYVVLPTAVDIVIDHIFDKIFDKGHPKIEWGISALFTFTAIYLIYGVPGLNVPAILMASLYLVYKISILFFIRNWEKANSRIMSIFNDAQELGKKLRFTIKDGQSSVPIEEVRQKWQDPEILQMAVDLNKKAAEEMKMLYADLEYRSVPSGATRKIKFQKMAERLVSDRLLSFRFCDSNTITLLDVYRLIRFLSYSYMKDGQLYYKVPEITEEDGLPFFQEGSPQWECRKVYNEIMDLFAPIMQELKELPPERQADVQRYWKWAVRDDSPKIANDQDGGFEPKPAEKPTKF